MTIGGIRISEAKFIVLSRLLEQDEVNVKSVNARTASALLVEGLIETFVPDARTLAMAERGRVRYYRLTKAGREAILGVKRLYHR
jgi:hypothetical protein